MSDSEEEMITSLANPEIIDKYKIAATVANGAMAHVASLVQPGVSILDLCQSGDDFIRAEMEKVCQKQKRILKGVGFPTSISVNNTVANFNPLRGDPVVQLQEGDVVKIDLGAHVDGILSQIGHTLVATAAPQEPITGRKADVICAAHFAGECALRLCRPGNKASVVTKAIRDVADVFQCNPVEGFHSFAVDRYTIEGEKSIPNCDEEDENGKKPEDITFEENEVYCIDILMSTGEGVVKEGAAKTSIYRKTDTMYQLKMKASRFVINEAATKYKQLPFTLRALEDEKRGRLGVVECLKSGLLQDYPVVYEKEGEYVAQFKFTVLLLPNSIQKLNAYNLPYVQSQYNITDPALTSILQMGLKRTSNAKKKKKKKKKKAATPAADAMDM